MVNKDDLPAIYESGQGKIKLRGKVEVEELKGGKKQLVITEIPYTMMGANIGKFLKFLRGRCKERQEQSKKNCFCFLFSEKILLICFIVVYN